MMRAGRFADDDQLAVGRRVRDIRPNFFELRGPEEGKRADGLGVFVTVVGVVGDLRVFDNVVNFRVGRRGREEESEIAKEKLLQRALVVRRVYGDH